MMRTPLILLPGMLCDSTLWESQIEALSDVADVTVGDLTGSNSISGMASRVLARAPERFALAGVSLGGLVALEIMRQAPNRVSRLCLLDCNAGPESSEAREKRMGVIAAVKQGNFKQVLSKQVGQLLHPENRDGPLTAKILEMGERAGSEQMLDQLHAAMERSDSRPTLPTITVPTLVIVGAEDAMTPPHLAREIAEGIEGSRLEIIEGAGHLPPMEKADAVNRVMRQWLNA